VKTGIVVMTTTALTAVVYSRPTRKNPMLMTTPSKARPTTRLHSVRMGMGLRTRMRWSAIRKNVAPARRRPKVGNGRMSRKTSFAAIGKRPKRSCTRSRLSGCWACRRATAAPTRLTDIAAIPAHLRGVAQDRRDPVRLPSHD
jgi:hypothetical protein